MVRRILLCLILSIFTFGFAQAQTGTIKGNIIDSDGLPLIGANVIVKGTTTGTITDIDGNYALTVPTGEQIIVASFIGYLSEEKPTTISNGQTATLNFTLIEDVTNLEELIVIGYGVQKKEDKTGAVAQIKAEELNGGVLTDAIQAIQGKSAGVSITKGGGDPNSGFKVKIRGASGFDSNTQPLYVIDGVPGVDPTTVAPEDIETFNILKDAASTAIYGSRGSNGVIIITTKKGNSGKGKVQFNTLVSIDNVAKKYDVLDASEIRGFAEDNNLQFVDGGSDTDWQDEIFRTGITQNYNLNYSGGTETSNYYVSLTHADWQGVMKGTGKERTIAKVNLTHKAFDNKLTLSGSMSGTFENNDYENYDGYDKDDIIYQAITRNPTDPVYNEDGSYYQTTREFNYENPMSVINKIDNTRDAKRFFGNFKADLEILDGLIASVNTGYTRDDHESYYFRPKGVYATADNGYASRKYENTSTKLIEATLNYNKSINDIHNFNALLGYSWQESIYDGFNAGGENPQSDYVGANDLGSLLEVQRKDIDSYKGMWRLIGFFGRVQYNYNSKYYASASLRHDGSTKFGEDNKWGWFPTVAAGWTLSREAFLEDITWLNNLKLRGSYGISGNQEIGEYKGQIMFEAKGTATNPETGQPVVTFGPAWNENTDLRWEKTSEINIGLDYALINSRISGSLELYFKNTDDLLGEYQVPVPPNVARTTFANSGTIKNQGVELFLQYFAVDQPNLKWKTSINISHNKQEMVDLGEYAPADGVRKEGYLSGRGLIGDQNYVSGIIAGEEIGSFYLPHYVGLSSDGAFLYTSNTGGVTREISQAKRSIVGTPNPDLELGWSNNLTIYENWTLDFSFRAMIGNDVYNATAMFMDYSGNIPNLNGAPEAVDWYGQGRSSGPAVSDYYIEDASFLRLDYLSLGYNFNTSDSKIFQSLRIYAASNNLITITGYSGVDPETSIDGVAYGIDQYNVYPKTRTITFGINATF